MHIPTQALANARATQTVPEPEVAILQVKPAPAPVPTVSTVTQTAENPLGKEVRKCASALALRSFFPFLFFATAVCVCV